MLRGMFYLTIRQALFVGSNVILHIYLARKLGLEQYGIYGVLASFIALNEFILMKAAYETLSRHVAAGGASAREIVRRSRGLFLLICFVVCVGYFLLSGQIASLLKDSGLRQFVRLCALIIPVSCLSTVYLGALNGMGRYGVQAFIAAVFVMIKLTFVVTLVWQGLSVKGVILGILTAELCQAGMAFFFGKKIEGQGECDFRQIYRFALQLIAVGLVGSLVINIDMFAVKMYLADNEETGLYTCALTIARMPVFMIYPVTLTMLPILAKSFAESRVAEINEKIVESVKYAIIMIVAPALLILATHDKCIALAYGRGYLGAGGALRILLLGSIAFSLKLIFYSAIVAAGRPGRIFAIGVISLALELTLLHLLTRRIGIGGAAIASTLTDVLGLILAAAYLYRRHLKRRLPLAWVRISIPAFLIYLMASYYSPEGMYLLMYYGLLMILYVLLLRAVGGVSAAKIKTAFRDAARV